MSRDGRDPPEEALRARLQRDAAPVPTSAFGRIRRTAGAMLRVRSLLKAVERAGPDGEGAVDQAALTRAVLGLGELKGIAMKMGQILSYVDGDLPPEMGQALGLLRTDSQPTPWSEVEAILLADLGSRGPALVGGLERTPVASASIGQVHRGRLPGGLAVAVKVRHPGIDEAIRADFRVARVGTSLARLLLPGADVDAVLAEAKARFLEECDYALEARRQQRFAELTAGHPRLVVPAVHPGWCGPRVLTTTWHQGLTPDEWLATSPSAAERSAVGRALYEFYLGSLYRHGLFNADPHPGNLLFDAQGRVVVLDHGCVPEFDVPTRRSLVALSRAVRADDQPAIRAALCALGGKDPGSGAAFATTRELLRGFYAPLLTPGPHPIRAGISHSLREITRSKMTVMRMRLPGRLLFLFRIRFGLYAVLSRLGAVADWCALEDEVTASY